ncbi:hypothetical protein [Streptomyces sp. NPDC087270]|uniref:hypothetical protein n=1 Tax=Streptomyces sp. NPDC087270 TaxID=3365774 RepID=UPI003814B01B
MAAAPAGHAERTSLPTGPGPVAYSDMAAELTRALGRAIAYRGVTPDGHGEGMIEAGLPEQVTGLQRAQLFWLLAEGDAAWLADDGVALTGSGPRDLRTYLTDRVTAFRWT